MSPLSQITFATNTGTGRESHVYQNRLFQTCGGRENIFPFWDSLHQELSVKRTSSVKAEPWHHVNSQEWDEQAWEPKIGIWKGKGQWEVLRFCFQSSQGAKAQVLHIPKTHLCSYLLHPTSLLWSFSNCSFSKISPESEMSICAVVGAPQRAARWCQMMRSLTLFP